MLFLTSCYPYTGVKSMLGTNNSYTYLVGKSINDAKKSFVKIQVNMVSSFECTPDSKKQGCIDTEISLGGFSGSGAIIKSNFMGTRVLTAAHVCSPEEFNHELKNISIFSKINKEILAISYYGVVGEFKIDKIDLEQDVCILKSKDFWPFVPTLKISKKAPSNGDKIQLLGAPRGLFWPGTVLFFDGYYVGLGDEQMAVYTVPVVSGVSGGPVINKKGQIIGIIHSGLADMENTGFGPNWHIIKEFTDYLF